MFLRERVRAKVPNYVLESIFDIHLDFMALKGDEEGDISGIVSSWSSILFKLKIWSSIIEVGPRRADKSTNVGSVFESNGWYEKIMERGLVPYGFAFQER